MPILLTSETGCIGKLAVGRVPGYPENQLSVRKVDGPAQYGQAREDRIEEATPQGPRHHRRGTQVFPKGEEDFIEQRGATFQDPLDAVVKLSVPSRHDPVFDAWVRNPKIVDVIEDLMGPNIKLYL